VGTYGQFDLAERMESLAEEVYSALAERCRSGQPGRPPFERLAVEENQHLQRVKMMRRRLLADSDSLGKVQLDVALAESAIAWGEQVLGRLQEMTDVPVDQAQTLALTLEERLATAHAHMLTPDCEPELRDFLLALARQDKAHLALLRG
jgi:rubrerythrin